MDGENGQALVESNGDQRLPPASLTKLMTVYIATKGIEAGRIGKNDLVIVNEHARRTGGLRMLIEVDSQVLVGDLLYDIIIQSGNGVSVALAEHIAGSEDAFIDMMNTTAQKLGPTNPRFMGTTGLPNPDYYSSARDMAVLAHVVIYGYPLCTSPSPRDS